MRRVQGTCAFFARFRKDDGRTDGNSSTFTFIGEESFRFPPLRRPLPPKRTRFASYWKLKSHNTHTRTHTHISKRRSRSVYVVRSAVHAHNRKRQRWFNNLWYGLLHRRSTAFCLYTAAIRLPDSTDTRSRTVRKRSFNGVRSPPRAVPE